MRRLIVRMAAPDGFTYPPQPKPPVPIEATPLPSYNVGFVNFVLQDEEVPQALKDLSAIHKESVRGFPQLERALPDIIVLSNDQYHLTYEI